MVAKIKDSNQSVVLAVEPFLHCFDGREDHRVYRDHLHVFATDIGDCHVNSESQMLRIAQNLSKNVFFGIWRLQIYQRF
jgi:hypothetical protein